MKILLIEDDIILGESLREYLTNNNFNAVWISDDRFIDEHIRHKKFDLILLDLMLKYNRGEDLIRKIKSKQSIPIIVTTAKGNLKDKELCFEYGADDYLVKPFSPKELILRIKAVLKRYIDIKDHFSSGSLYVNFKNRTLTVGSKEIKLTYTEWNLLSLFIKNRGKIISNNDILNYVWDNNPVGDESIRTYVKRLRSILPDGVIKTYKGRGYKFIDEI